MEAPAKQQCLKIRNGACEILAHLECKIHEGIA